MRKLGIAAKLYLAFGSIFLLAVVASSVGWQGFERVTDSQSSVIDRAIPGLRQAHRLSALNASIGAASRQLLRAHDEADRVRISMALFSEVAEVNALLVDFEQEGFATEALPALRQTFGLIEDKLRLQDDLVRQRTQQEAHFEQLAGSLIATTEALNELADSLVANAAATTTAITSNLYDLVEDDAGKQQLYNVFDRLVEVDLDAMERMYELRLRSANLNALFNRVARETKLQELAELRRSTAETLLILNRRVSEINDPQRRHAASELLSAMEIDSGPIYVYGIFETRISLLQIDETLTRLSLETSEASQRLSAIVNEINTAGGRLINQVSTSARESLDLSRQLFTAISIVLLLVAAAILWWFIKRNVVRRLTSLQSATRSITEGDYEVDIVVEGHDELTDMGRALRGFRDNAIENRKLDEELRRHKTHLEELVEERSEQLRDANRLLSEEVENHAVARQKAEQASEAKTAFLATMSHELRTPLSGALGTLRLLADTELQSRQRDYVNIIDAANASLLDIVNDILGYSQLEAGKLNIENRRFQLGELMNNVTGLMTVAVRDKNNDLSLQIEGDPEQWFLGDSGKLHQVLINLVGNANKFTDDGSITLTVKCRPDAEGKAASLDFSVTDTGIGIAEDKQEEVFQAFTQVDASSARLHGGIGLGLAICERLVHALGGEISLRSEPGKGTRIGFRVDIDLCEAPSAAEAEVGSSAPVASERVLMVEDDATNSMVTLSYLQHLGHQVVAAQNGEEALALLDRENLSLVLLDISLPGIDGLTILRHIRAHSESRIADLPVIAMSAHVFTEEVDEYLAAGMNGFLGKPFSIEDLEQALTTAVTGGEVMVKRPGKPAAAPTENVIDTSVVDGDVDRLGIENVEQLAGLFRRSAYPLLEELQQAISAGNLETRQKLAHKLSGAAANFGLDRLRALLAEIEFRAGSGLETGEDTVTRLRVEFDLAITALDEHLAARQVPAEKVSASTGR